MRRSALKLGRNAQQSGGVVDRCFLAAKPTSLYRILPTPYPLAWYKGKYDEAERLYLKAIAIGEKALGADHPKVAEWLNNRAKLLQGLVRVE